MNNKKIILIIDESEDLRKGLKWILQPLGFDVVEAANSLDAKPLLDKKPALIISDYRASDATGFSLLKWIKEHQINIPYIAMSAPDNIFSTIQVLELGMSGFIPKPFEAKDVIEAVNSIFETNKVEYSRVPISSFLSGMAFPFNIYIKANDQKYIKIAHEGEDLEISRLQAYHEKKVDYLYISKDDFQKFIGLNLNFFKGSSSTNVVPLQKRQEFVHKMGASLIEYAFVDGINKESFNNAKEYVETAVNIVTESEDLFFLLHSLSEQMEHLYLHSLAVSIYSVLLAKEMTWNSATTLYKLALGGLFHDIGKKELDPKVINTPAADLSHLELKQLESHVGRGIEILESTHCVSDDIIQIVAQHHEAFDGSGYPSHLSRAGIFPMAKVVCVANHFCNAMFTKGKAKRKLEEVIGLLSLSESSFDPQIFAALKSLFKFGKKS